jgi:DNA-binding transcriptional regulator YdaS (Cro superfamily)
MLNKIPAHTRRRLAATAGVADQYLYQCLTGRRDMDAAEARRVETATNHQLRRWHLRQKDWHLIWPELIDMAGAPPVTRCPATSTAHSEPIA